MLKKLSFGLALTAAFGLMACSDSSSSSGGSITVSCKVVSQNPFTIKSTEGNISGTVKFELNKDGIVVETNEFATEAMQQEVCEERQDDSEYKEVECSGKKVVTYSSDTMTEKEFKEHIESAEAWCKESDGKKIKIDDDGEDVIDLDDDDDGDEGGEFLPNKPSCVFDEDADEWGYSYSTGKDASGTSSATDVEYRIEGKDLVQVTTVESIGSNVKLACSIAKEGDGEYKDEYVSSKIETTCTDDGMITKMTTIDYGYMDEHTKEQVVKNIKAGCEAI